MASLEENDKSTIFTCFNKLSCPISVKKRWNKSTLPQKIDSMPVYNLSISKRIYKNTQTDPNHYDNCAEDHPKRKQIRNHRYTMQEFQLTGLVSAGVSMSVSISLLVSSHNGTAPFLMRYHAHGSVRECKLSNKFLRIICSVG